MSTLLLIGIILFTFSVIGAVYHAEKTVKHLEMMDSGENFDPPSSKFVMILLSLSGFSGVMLVTVALIRDYLIPAIF